MGERILERDPADPRKRAREPISPALKFALEMGPLAIFFFATFRGEWLVGLIPALGMLGKPLFVATALFMAATLLSLGLSWALTRTLPLMPLVSGVVVLVFGALSIWLQNDTFIKMKPTIVYTLFGGLLLGGLAFGKSLLGYAFDAAFNLDAEGWRKLTFRWGLFFLFSAVLNEAVWRGLAAIYPPQQADEYWAAFKLFGFMGLTFIFVLTQMPLITRHSVEEKAER